ncbi:hypothetical protein K435DRAFT_397583 [Dendrothele bispora CBS 962.96]|uniref:Trypsin-like serine protease n=1 Tax=Dendrothele bispora (strain CBS 962.96) TaxID=1314807 RepID=A0A4S8L822_DENBC|nr:hypothetical protein K435DRAFT_397583 [Dendrothele bispora CBS 962.96]
MSMTEAAFYYAGLPSAPILIARTSTTPWKAPTGPEAYLRRKELRPVGRHALVEVWEDNLAFKIHALLKNVMWTSTDIVRIGYADELELPSAPPPPVILWIGVMPESLSSEDGFVVASKCKKLLEEHGITDVDVEIRESVVTRSESESAGPKFFSSIYSSDPASMICNPLTTTLGFPISAQSTPWSQGTGGFFITEGADTERLLLVTARHVVFTPDRDGNEHFEHSDNSERRHNVTVFGNTGFERYLESIQTEIEGQTFMVKHQEGRIRMFEGKTDPLANKRREKSQFALEEAKEAVEELNTFYQNVSTQWANPESRILGHVILSPPINVNVGSEGYTEDWAVIEVDASKIDSGNFSGNVIDLGNLISPDKFTNMMCPNPQSRHSFTYPYDHILRIKGTIPEDEMRHPTAFDQNGEPCFMVIKRGNATGLTVGRATNIFSYVRYYNDGMRSNEPSKEWTILPFDSKSGPFSDKGDSGSVIVDGRGRMGGLLIGGTGKNTQFLDLTYATPIGFLLRCMESRGLCKPNVDPVFAA